MITIREPQMRAFREYQLRRFRTAAAARWNGPQDKLQACIDAAQRHGLATEHHILRFIDLVRELGTGFDASPWAAEILRDDELTPDLKIRMLQLRARDHTPPAG